MNDMFSFHIIESGYIMVDGGAMFGAVPKRAWKRRYKSDEDNLCRLSMRCVLAVSDQRKILIDTGMGNKHLKETAYYQPQGLQDMTHALRYYGYGVEDITDVVLTHLHFDHCGGATCTHSDGRVLPSFPEARYWLGKAQWESFQSPNKLEEDSFFADNIWPVYQAGQLQLVDTDTILCDGFSMRLFDGHTSGQLAVLIDTHDGKYVFAGDVIPTAAHVALGWISAYDICALTSLTEKERLLKEAVENNYSIIYCHDEFVISSKIKRLNDDYKAIISP